jgi:hypothetical protein
VANVASEHRRVESRELLNGRQVFISLRTKFSSAERKYSVPLECFRDLIAEFEI